MVEKTADADSLFESFNGKFQKEIDFELFTDKRIVTPELHPDLNMLDDGFESMPNQVVEPFSDQFNGFPSFPT